MGVTLLCAFTEGMNLFAVISLLLLICCCVLLSMGIATTSRKFWGSFCCFSSGKYTLTLLSSSLAVEYTRWYL